MCDVTHILAAIERGEPTAAEQLLPLVYDELRKLAAARLAQERPGQTLQATALVHETYLRLVGQVAGDWQLGTGESNQPTTAPTLSPQPQAPAFHSRGHFFAAAAEAMRRILVNKAIRKQRPKHGGDWERVDFDSIAEVGEDSSDSILELDAALTKLAAADPLSAEVVKLKYFAGLSLPQVAAALSISARTADRRWAYARAFLHQELTTG